MKKVNLLSKAEMKLIMGGTGPVGGHVMHCRKADSELATPVFDVADCDTSKWDGYCSEFIGYEKEKSNCNTW